MTNQNKITRREAIKLLGAAAGASVLANLPSKWSKPELTGGVLPAHAQTSCVAMTMSLNFSSGSSHFSKYQGPAPDSQDGAFYAYDGSSHSPDPVYSASWNCQVGCLQLGFVVQNGSNSWDINIYGDSFQINLNSVLLPGMPLLVDLETGEHSENTNTPLSNCSWQNG